MSRLGKFSYSTPAAVLAVDGGNSKTDVALVDAAGNVLGAARGPGTSHHHLGVPAAMEALEALVAAACADAGLPAAGRPLAAAGVFCLAGLDLPADDQALGPAVAGRRWAEQVLLHNDVFAVLRAGSARTWGVGVVLGAGAGLDVDVVCGGGLFSGDAPAFSEFFERIGAEVRRLAPAARLTRVTAPPVLGAALLGLDRLGAAPGAVERLRATLIHERLAAHRPVAASNR